MNEFLINYLVDIIIAIISLAVIISSFYKPTFRYVRHLVGLLVSFLAIFLLKTVNLFNIVEVFIEGLFAKINFKAFVSQALGFLGYANLAEYKLDSVYYLSIMFIFGLVVFLLVNLLMGLAHSKKVAQANKRGEYVYSKPIGSFLLALVLLVIGLFTTTIIFATLPFDIDYISQSHVFKFLNSLLENGYGFIKPFVPMFDGLEHYTDVVVRIIG